MFYSINPETLAGEIGYSAIQRYLQENGWKPFKTKRSDISIFQYFEDNQFEQVVIPKDKEISDYAISMYRAVQTIADVEKKPIEEILLKLLEPNSYTLILLPSNESTAAKPVSSSLIFG